MVTIREADEIDIPLIGELAERTWWRSYGDILQNEQIEYMLRTIYSPSAMQKVMLDGSQKFLLLYQDSLPVGFASYGVHDEQSRCWKIFKLYVLPECHGLGFGKQLIDEIVSRAKKDNVDQLILNVNRYNPAFHFYKKHGFEVLQEVDIPIGPYWMNDYVMSLSLSR